MANEMHIYEDVKDMVEDEIEKILKKGELDEKCLGYLDKLVDIAKDVDTITAMHEYGAEAEEEMRGYSGRMYPPMYNYDSGRSYGYNGNSMRRYSGNTQDWNGDGRSNGYRNGYSRGGSDMVARLNQMMNEASTEHEREAIRMALQQM